MKYAERIEQLGNVFAKVNAAHNLLAAKLPADVPPDSTAAGCLAQALCNACALFEGLIEDIGDLYDDTEVLRRRVG